ncbi:unnamed protein product [Thlaspi arvense]|uniref:Uncharacterized protein n=1 Tax=Thlaspi arvense TaxID=13288 RepID=A0AAU9S2N1_THLAR|nr:unnamed protein product [Thlaspi arvense]
MTISQHLLPAQEEVVNKTRAFEKMKSEAEKCLAQGERLSKEKIEFEDATYAKACVFVKRFVSVLNKKKAKLRALRDKEDSVRAVEEEESTDIAESFESGRSDNEQSEEEASNKATTSTKERGRKRAARSKKIPLPL